MRAAAIRRGAFRACLVAGGAALCPVALRHSGLPGPFLAAAMLALPCALLAVLRREGRLLADAASRARRGGLGPTLRQLLLGGGR